MSKKPSYEELEQKISHLEKVEKELISTKTSLKENEKFLKMY